jgi:hypothetical protein
MRGLFVRVGADQTEGGGGWNAPVNSVTRKFVYVPIPEAFPIRRGFAKSYSLVSPFLQRFTAQLPSHLTNRNMHLDPDFDHLSYGDRGEGGARGDQVKRKLGAGDLLVFYASLADLNSNLRLVYAIIGLYVIDAIVDAVTVPKSRWDENAHTRRLLGKAAKDIIVRARPKVSGRLQTCLPIGEFRNRAYRVTRQLLKRWGGLSVEDGYLQRSARLPEMLNAAAFYDWFKEQYPRLIARNN